MLLLLLMAAVAAATAAAADADAGVGGTEEGCERDARSKWSGRVKRGESCADFVGSFLMSSSSLIRSEQRSCSETSHGDSSEWSSPRLSSPLSCMVSLWHTSNAWPTVRTIRMACDFLFVLNTQHLNTSLLPSRAM
uniref:Putative secreted protein n=1 Tax=Anopheles triannulatus TaxID=58253 RepID=A0A2M4B3U2_9DIPT